MRWPWNLTRFQCLISIWGTLFPQYCGGVKSTLDSPIFLCNTLSQSQLSWIKSYCIRLLSPLQIRAATYLYIMFLVKSNQLRASIVVPIYKSIADELDQEGGSVPATPHVRIEKKENLLPIEYAINMLLVRGAFDVLRSPSVNAALKAHIHKKLNELRFPSWLHSIEVPYPTPFHSIPFHSTPFCCVLFCSILFYSIPLL